MNKKEEELLSMHYQMEKTDIKQQRMDDRLMSMADDLRKSKRIRNFYFIFILILMLLLTAGTLYVTLNWQKDSGVSNQSEQPDDVQRLILLNDSLRAQITELKGYVYGGIDTLGLKNGDSTHFNNRMGHLFSSDSVADNSKKKKYEKTYCYINKAYESNDVIFIEADIIEYYEGKKAVKKAREYGEAEYDVDKNGDTLYFLYNNYYIHNQSPKGVILELDDRARVKTDNINQISNSFSLKAFKKVLIDKPILVLEIDDGIVYKITEQKLP
ncbi:hypothetical protein [Aquimarina pacifica]|uniref:hypothetical protein n=1 Tax=Aquimarina pacifica TaxID=1296415 RepID=UPI00047189F6|nr:hypothetical protein [Aquimarina pacifica]